MLLEIDELLNVQYFLSTMGWMVVIWLQISRKLVRTHLMSIELTVSVYFTLLLALHCQLVF